MIPDRGTTAAPTLAVGYDAVIAVDPSIYDITDDARGRAWAFKLTDDTRAALADAVRDSLEHPQAVERVDVEPGYLRVRYAPTPAARRRRTPLRRCSPMIGRETGRRPRRPTTTRTPPARWAAGWINSIRSGEGFSALLKPSVSDNLARPCWIQSVHPVRTGGLSHRVWTEYTDH